MKVLITGAQGFIGHLLKQKFQAIHWSVHDFAGDILKAADLQKYFYPGCDWDVVIHLAGLSAIGDCEKDPTLAYQINATGSFLIADSITQFCPRAHLIFASTAQVYDFTGSLDLPINELHPVRPQNTYAKTKRAAELYIEDSFKNSQSAYTILRIFNHSHKSQRPDFFMPSMYQQMLQKKSLDGSVTLEVGNLNVIRDIGTVQDLMEAFVQVAKKSRPSPEIYNVCSGIGKSLHDVVTELARVQDIKLNIQERPERMRKGDAPRIVGSCDKFKQNYDWQPRFAADEKHLVQAFLQNLS